MGLVHSARLERGQLQTISYRSSRGVDFPDRLECGGLAGRLAQRERSQQYDPKARDVWCRCMVAAVSAGLLGRAQAQTVSVSVDATAVGTPLERVWPYHGYDEVNYSTTPEGEALLKALATAHTARFTCDRISCSTPATA